MGEKYFRGRKILESGRARCFYVPINLRRQLSGRVIEGIIFEGLKCGELTHYRRYTLRTDPLGAESLVYFCSGKFHCNCVAQIYYGVSVYTDCGTS